MTYPIPANEASRILDLHSLSILDSAPEEIFDCLTKLAAEICETPWAAITLIDSDRQWLKSKLGIATSETSRDAAICGHTIMQFTPLIVEDASADERFKNFESVKDGLKFYAGAPLITENGHALGAICVIDNTKHELRGMQSLALQVLARIVTSLMELKRESSDLDAQNSSLMHAELKLDELALAFGHNPKIDSYIDRSKNILEEMKKSQEGIPS